MTSSDEQLIRIIEKRIDANERIPDMVLDDFIELVAKACKEICSPIEKLSSAKKKDRMTDATFGAFAQRLQDMFVYELFDELTTDMVFRLGACWGGVTTVEKCEEHQRDSEHEKEELRYIGKHQDLFDGINEKPGRCHHEIAEEMGVSDSRLSQIIKEGKLHQLISTSIQGRSKHYYLTRKGKARYLAYFDRDNAAPSNDADASQDTLRTNKNGWGPDEKLSLGWIAVSADNAGKERQNANGQLNESFSIRLGNLLEEKKHVRAS